MRAIFNFTLTAIIFALIGAVIASSIYPSLDTTYTQLQKDYDRYIDAQAHFMAEPSKINIQKVDQQEDFIFQATYVIEQQTWLNSWILRKKPILTSKQEKTLRTQLANAKQLDQQFKQTALQEVYHAKNIEPYLRDTNTKMTDELFVTRDSNGITVTFDAGGATFENHFTNSITGNYFFIQTAKHRFYLRKMSGYEIESSSSNAISIKMDGKRYHFIATIDSDE